VRTKALWIMEFYDILYNMSNFGVFPNFPFKAVCEARSEGLAPEETTSYYDQFLFYQSTKSLDYNMLLLL